MRELAELKFERTSCHARLKSPTLQFTTEFIQTLKLRRDYNLILTENKLKKKRNHHYCDLLLTSERTLQTRSRGRSELRQILLCVQDLSVGFSWQEDVGDVNIMTRAETVEPSVQGSRWTGRLEHT